MDGRGGMKDKGWKRGMEYEGGKGTKRREELHHTPLAHSVALLQFPLKFCKHFNGDTLSSLW
jgi:hypothetical protein